MRITSTKARTTTEIWATARTWWGWCRRGDGRGRKGATHAVCVHASMYMYRI